MRSGRLTEPGFGGFKREDCFEEDPNSPHAAESETDPRDPVSRSMEGDDHSDHREQPDPEGETESGAPPPRSRVPE